MEASYRVRYPTATKWNLAAQQLVDCVKTNTTQGCLGGYVWDAWNYATVQKGLNQEVNYPYKSGVTGIAQSCVPKATDKKIVLNSTGAYSYMFNATYDNIAFYLSYVPLAGYVMNVNDGRFLFYKKGTLDCTGIAPNVANTAVNIIGHNATHFFIRSSLGTSWGYSGDAYIAKNVTNDCNIRVFFAFTNPVG